MYQCNIQYTYEIIETICTLCFTLFLTLGFYWIHELFIDFIVNGWFESEN